MSIEIIKDVSDSFSGSIGKYNFILSQNSLVIEGKKWLPLWGSLLFIALIASIFFLAPPELLEIYKEEGWSGDLIRSVLLLIFAQLMFILLLFSRYLFKQRLYFTPDELTIERKIGRTRVFQKSEAQSLRVKREGSANEDKVAYILLVLKNQKKITLAGLGGLHILPNLNAYMVEVESAKMVNLIQTFWGVEIEKEA